MDLTLLTGFGSEEPYIRDQIEPLAELKEAPEILIELDKRRTEFERYRYP